MVKVLENAIEIVENDNPKLGIMINENSKQYVLSKYERNDDILSFYYIIFINNLKSQFNCRILKQKFFKNNTSALSDYIH